MMQTSEIQQRFKQIQQTVDHASRACRSVPNLPSELKECITELTQQTTGASKVFQSQDQEQILACVDELEELGDRAKHACEESGDISQSVREAVMQAHQELSNLKHQMH